MCWLNIKEYQDELKEYQDVQSFFDKIKDKDELEVIVSQFVINRIL